MNAARLVAETERHFGLHSGAIMKGKKHRQVSWRRQLVMYVLRTELGWSFPRIAQWLGLTNHSTVRYGCIVFSERAARVPSHLNDVLAIAAAVGRTA